METIRVEEIDRDGMPVILLDYEIAPKSEADGFRRKYQLGPERFRQAIVNAWLKKFWNHYEAIRWLTRGDFVAFADLPRDPEEWEGWLRTYAAEMYGVPSYTRDANKC